MASVISFFTKPKRFSGGATLPVTEPRTSGRNFRNKLQKFQRDKARREKEMMRRGVEDW